MNIHGLKKKLRRVSKSIKYFESKRRSLRATESLLAARRNIKRQIQKLREAKRGKK